MSLGSQLNTKWTDTTSSSWQSLLVFSRHYGFIFAGAYLITLIIYSYFFTTILFNDHLFSNIWFTPFPSFRTTAVGRWFADFLNYIVGGVGVQAFQMSLATGIQVVNGLLFAVFIGLRKPLHVFIATLFICLHPAFLDYYSFTRDHIGFTLSDTLIILGVLALERFSNPKVGMAMGTTCFIFALATYQPKIALIALLLIFLCIHGVFHLADEMKVRMRSILIIKLFVSRYVLRGLFSFVMAVFLYYVSARMVISRPEEIHTEVNNIGEIFFGIEFSYLAIIRNLTVMVDYLPDGIRWLPFATSLLGIIIYVWQAWQRKPVLGLIVIILVALIPIALQLSFILNDNTPVAGRTLAPQAYCLLFFIASLWNLRGAQHVGTAISLIFVYYFSIVGSQETNLAAMKHIFDVGKMNRIVSRLESLSFDDLHHRIPVVVVGYLKSRDRPPIRRFANNLFKPRTRYEFFNEFCQPEILNFFLGRQGLVLMRPTRAQVDAAIASQGTRRPWPASDSVYLQDGTLVILLERYVPGKTMVTWPREKFNKEWPEQQAFCG